MLPIHFGLGNYSAEVLYAGGIIAIVLSLFWRPLAGLFYLVPILPLQTVRYRMNDLPLGASMVTLVMLAVTLGILRRRDGAFTKTPWSKLLAIYCGYLILSLCMGSYYLGHKVPLYFDDSRVADFKDYLLMPLLLLCIAGAVKTRREIWIVVVLMYLGAAAVDRGVAGTFWDRDYSTYSDTMRESGVMGHAGANGLGAFTAQATVFAVAMAAVDKKRWRRVLYYALAAFSAYCLMYSFSRGGYLACLAGLAFVGIRKQPVLIALLIVLALVWTLVLPSVVRERVNVTNDGLDHSSETRVELWSDALSLVGTNILFGTGVDTYAYLGRWGDYRDTHNIFVKVLVETGLVGTALFLWLLARTFRIGMRLLGTSKDDLFGGLGLALSAWVICSAVANLFGDRWNYLQVNSYMWIICGLVSRALVIDKRVEPKKKSPDEIEETDGVTGLEMADAF